MLLNKKIVPENIFLNVLIWPRLYGAIGYVGHVDSSLFIQAAD